jgi:hypothetical protein
MMRRAHLLLLLTLTIFGVVSQASAATFNFSYTFAGGESLTGTVDGVLQPDGVTVLNLSNLNAVYSGTPDRIFDNFGPSFVGRTLRLDGAFPGLEFYGMEDPVTPTRTPNFGFRLGAGGLGNSVTVGTFEAGENGLRFPMADVLEAEPFSVSRFSASAVVPEPGSCALLLSGLAAALAWKRRFLHRQD